MRGLERIAVPDLAARLEEPVARALLDLVEGGAGEQVRWVDVLALELDKLATIDRDAVRVSCRVTERGIAVAGELETLRDATEGRR